MYVCMYVVIYVCIYVYMSSKRQTMYPPCYYQSANDLTVTHALGQMMYMIYYTHPASV